MDKGTGDKLFSIENTAQIYAEIISETLQVNTEIIGVSLARIAGVGTCSGTARIISDGVIYRRVFHTAKHVIIQNPRRDLLCDECVNHDRCLEKMEAAYPLIYHNEIIGAIGVVCTTYEQRLKLMENLRFSVSFINHMCTLMMQALESREKITAYEQQLETLRLNRPSEQEKTHEPIDESNIEIRKLDDVETEYIELALRKYGSDTAGKKLAAESLGIGIATLYRKLNKEI